MSEKARFLQSLRGVLPRDRLEVQLPRESVKSAPEECPKCHEDVDDWWPDPSETSDYYTRISGYCGVCGQRWDGGFPQFPNDENMPEFLKEREEHWADCDGKRTTELGGRSELYCTACGEELPSVITAVCSPPVGKWIIGGYLTSSTPGQNKGFLVEEVYMRNTTENVRNLIKELGEWEGRNNTWD